MAKRTHKAKQHPHKRAPKVRHAVVISHAASLDSTIKLFRLDKRQVNHVRSLVDDIVGEPSA